MVRVLLAEDYDAIRSTLRAFILLTPGLELAGEATNGVEAIELADTTVPDVVIIDVRMPEMDGIEATRIIKERHPSMRVIVHSVYAHAAMRRAATDAGADDFVVKGQLKPEYLEALVG